MTQSTGFDAAGQGSSGTDFGNNSTSSGAGSFGGGDSMSQSGRGAGFNQGSSDNQGWMPQSFGGGSGDVMGSIRDFGRNNRAATIGGGILAVLALARYASKLGKQRQEQRSGGNWMSSGQSRYGDDDRFGRADFRGARGYSRDSFSGSHGRYTGASSSGGNYGYGTLRQVGRYGMKHPVALTAGAALSAMALSWLARGSGQQNSQGGGSQDFGAAYGGRDFRGSGQDFNSRGNEAGEGFQGGLAGSGSSFGGSGSTASGGGFGAGSSGTQSFGSGSMGSDAIEATGSSGDIGQGTTGSSFGRGRTGSGSASG